MSSKSSKTAQVYNIVDSRHRSPPYEWAEGIFQSWSPISGDFEIGNNFFGTKPCGNNPTGRAFTANPCGYDQEKCLNEQFNVGKKYSQENGNSLFPVKSGIITPPQDRVVYGLTRVGEQYINK